MEDMGGAGRDPGGVIEGTVGKMANSEERIYSATSGRGGSAKRVGGRVHLEWRAPLH